MKQQNNMQIQIKEYAPVLIPTLNRVDHLKNCIESLEDCTYAEQTEVYVGLDYPPSQKYEAGWRKVEDYLKEKVNNNRFKQLIIERRDSNCGAVLNSNLLIDSIKNKYSGYIFTEDDNVFSPNFLDYMNQGLALYKEDSRIMAICGYSYIDIAKDPTANNNIAYRKYSGWGTGQWCDKVFAYKKIDRSEYRELLLKSWKTTLRLWRLHPISVNDFLSMHFRNQTYGDSLANAQLSLENKYCVFPKLSMVRNCGHDGSGEHCGTSSVFTNQEIDTSNTFDYDELVLSKDFPNDTYFKNKLISSIIVPSVALIRYIGYKLLNIDLFGFYFKK